MSGSDDADRRGGTIRVDQFFPHPVAKVWRALTTPEFMAKWLMPNGFRTYVGHHLTMQAKPIPAVEFSGTVACEVLEVEPPRLLGISGADANGASSLRSTVTWRLEVEGNGTRVFLEHSGFDPDDPTHQIALRNMGSGWRSHVLRRFEDVLDELTDTSETTGSSRRT